MAFESHARKGEVSTGTTIMAVAFDGGVVLGADSRVSTGTYIANRVSDKVAALHDSIFMCRSGSAADTQAISDYVRYWLATHATEVMQLYHIFLREYIRAAACSIAPKSS